MRKSNKAWTSSKARNFIQQGRVFNNSADVAAPAPPTRRRPLNKPAYENNGLQQWSKVAQAQQLAVARVQPLRVNLPTRGLHHAFTQILQTEVNKPLSIQFTAANTQSGGLVPAVVRRVAGPAGPVGRRQIPPQPPS